MRIIRNLVFAATVAAMSLGAAGQGSNQPAKSCGTFEFSGAPEGFGGIDFTMRFRFTPTQQKCGVNACVCQRIGYVQVLRGRDLENDIYIQPFQEQQRRMVVNPAPQLSGWAVDRLPPVDDWGYFKALDVTPIDFVENDRFTLGTNGQPVKRAKMSDAPQLWPPRVQIEAVSVPVCLDHGGACGDKMLGYRTWQFEVDADQNASDPTHRASTKWEREAATLAVKKWNTRANAASKHKFPSELKPITQE